MWARWKSLRPGTLYMEGLADWSPEGTEETGTCGEHHSSPEEAIHISPGPWRARTEPLEMTQRRWTDSSWASVPPEASLYNCKSPNIPYYHNNLRWGWRCGPKKVLPTISTPWCGDWGRTPGSVLEVIASLAESIHPVCLSVAQLAPRPASRSLTWARMSHHLKQLIIPGDWGGGGCLHHRGKCPQSESAKFNGWGRR